MGWLDPSSLLHRLSHSAAADLPCGGPSGAVQGAGPLPCQRQPADEAHADADADNPAHAGPAPAGSSFVADLLNWQQTHGEAQRPLRVTREPGGAAR